MPCTILGCPLPAGNLLGPACMDANVVDVKDVKYVINYDMPNNIEDYVHRIGRTGRANSTGTSLSFFTSDNVKLARDLVNILREAGQPVEPSLESMSLRPSYGGGGRFSRGRGRGGGGGFGSRGGGGFGRSTHLTGANSGYMGGAPSY